MPRPIPSSDPEDSGWVRPKRHKYDTESGGSKSITVKYTERDDGHVGWLLLPDGWHEVSKEVEKFGYGRATQDL